MPGNRGKQRTRRKIKWVRLKISSKKKEISREHFMQEWGMIKDRNGKQKQKRLRRGGKNTQKN